MMTRGDISYHVTDIFSQLCVIDPMLFVEALGCHGLSPFRV